MADTDSSVRILVVEDDKSVCLLMKTTLKAHGYNFEMATSGEAAIMKAASYHPDIVLLDLGLPDMDGIQVIETIRGWSSAPIIVISARNEDEDKITALDAGADDYLTKPFSVDELLARIRVSQRRIAQLGIVEAEESSRYVSGDLCIDYAAGTVDIAGEPVRLTPIEYKLLCLLSRHTGRVLTHTFILRNIWGSYVESDIASLRVHMATLRKKIEKDPRHPTYIQTHIGVGYRMLKN